MRVAVVPLVLLAIASINVSTAEANLCANTYGGDVIAPHRVGCAKARHVVRTWAVRYRRDGKVNRQVLGFRCRDRSDNVEGLVVRCSRGRQSVRFYANVPR